MSDYQRALSVILFEPEIPPNTGNLIRLCANTGVQLHLVEPLGFSMDTKSLRRAGLDYHQSACVAVHENIEACLQVLDANKARRRIFAISTKGSVSYSEPVYVSDDIFLFGPETRGLPDTLLKDTRIHGTLRIPMKSDSRSLNLANAVSIVTFEALRQLNFPGLN